MNADKRRYPQNEVHLIKASIHLRSSATPFCFLVGRFEIPAEISRHARPPGIEGIGRRVIPGLPVHVPGDVVDVAEVLRQAAPGVADVMEEIRSDDVAAEAPAVAVALVEQPAAA